MNTTYKASVKHDKTQYNNIRLDLIYKIDNAKFFDNESEINKYLNNILINICKEVFIESYENGGKEAGAVYDISRDLYAIHKATKYDVVDFIEDTSEKYYEIYSTIEDFNGIIIHNHNTPDTFSKRDIVNFLRDTAISVIIVITCNANIFILVKKEKKDYEKLGEEINNQYKTDMITPNIKSLLSENNLRIRRIV